MKSFKLIALSYNNKSLNHFLELLKKHLKNEQTNIIKIGRFVKIKKKVTVLKSPHVNKTAQEQFEKRKKLVKIILTTKNPNKTIIILKKVFNTMFSDVKLFIKYLINSRNCKTNQLYILKNTNFKLNFCNKINLNKPLRKKKKKYLYNDKKFIIKFKTYINALNSCGEIFIRS